MPKFPGEIPDLGLDKFPEFEPAIKDRLEQGFINYDLLRRDVVDIGLLFKESSDMNPVNRFVERAAMLQFLGSVGLFETFMQQDGHALFLTPDRLDKSDLDIFMMHLSPKKAVMQVDYKYQPGQMNTGWNETLIAYRRKYKTDERVVKHNELKRPLDILAEQS